MSRRSKQKYFELTDKQKEFVKSGKPGYARDDIRKKLEILEDIDKLSEMLSALSLSSIWKKNPKDEELLRRVYGKLVDLHSRLYGITEYTSAETEKYKERIGNKNLGNSKPYSVKNVKSEPRTFSGSTCQETINYLVKNVKSNSRGMLWIRTIILLLEKDKIEKTYLEKKLCKRKVSNRICTSLEEKGIITICKYEGNMEYIACTENGNCILIFLMRKICDDDELRSVWVNQKKYLGVGKPTVTDSVLLSGVR